MLGFSEPPSGMLKCWCISLVLFMFFLTLLFWQHLSMALGGSTNSVFVDKICINQADPTMKAAGIRSFGAFLARTDSMLVLWEKSYFKRLWCTYELAAFISARAHGRIVVVPVALYGHVGILFLLIAFIQLVLTVLEPMGLPAMVEPAIYVGYQLVFTFTLRRAVQDLLELQDDWISFSVRDTECFCCTQSHVHPVTGEQIPCDRELVYESISHWYGDGDRDAGLDGFDIIAQGDLRAETAGINWNERRPAF